MITVLEIGKPATAPARRRRIARRRLAGARLRSRGALLVRQHPRRAHRRHRGGDWGLRRARRWRGVLWRGEPVPTLDVRALYARAETAIWADRAAASRRSEPPSVPDAPLRMTAAAPRQLRCLPAPAARTEIDDEHTPASAMDGCAAANGGRRR